MTQMPPRVNLLTLTKPLLADYIYIAHHMPEDQRRQWSALGDGKPFDPETMAICLASRSGPRWTLVEPDGTPVVLGGFDMIREGVWQDFMIGTEDGWRKHWRGITKHSKRVMDLMLNTEAHRLQCVALADRTMARKWFAAVGLEYEGTLRGYGYNGEDAVMYARIK